MTGAKPPRPIIIAIDGRSGAGKTTLAVELAAQLREHHSVSLFHLEDIYPGWNGLQQGMVDYRRTLLAPLHQGEEARWTTWDWEQNKGGHQRTTAPAEIILTEGVGAAHAEARGLIDVAIWVEVGPVERKQRALARDGNLFAPFWEQWAEQESRWLSKDRIGAAADLIIDGRIVERAAEQVLRALASLPVLQTTLGPERLQPQSRTVAVEHLPVHPDPAALFERLYAHSERTVWLDSSNAAHTVDRNRFSIMADDGGAYGQWASHRSGLTTVRAGAVTSRIAGPFFHWLDTVWGRAEAPAPGNYPAEFLLGWLGYLGYELKRETGGADVNSSTDDAGLIFAARAVVYDHAAQCIYLLALQDSANQTEADSWLAETAKVVRDLAASPSVPYRRAAPVAVVPVAVPAVVMPVVAVRDDKESYLGLIRDARTEIAEGNSYEICLTTQLEISAEQRLDPWRTYSSLREHSPAPFAAYFRAGALTVASTSPERFLRIDADGTMVAEPIKGTRPRGRQPAQDAELRRELADSAKDRAENIMIVDLLRNDLSHFAAAGSVSVSRLCEVESYATVHQLVSTITARLRPGADRAAAVAAAFPPGSMTGAPKISTMTILDRLESGPRGVYAGVLGYFSLTGAADLAVTIRTLVLEDQSPAADVDRPTQRLSLGVGGAITADSDPHEEWNEIRTKAAGILSALGTRFPAVAVPCDRAAVGNRRPPN